MPAGNRRSRKIIKPYPNEDGRSKIGGLLILYTALNLKPNYKNRNTKSVIKNALNIIATKNIKPVAAVIEWASAVDKISHIDIDPITEHNITGGWAIHHWGYPWSILRFAEYGD